MCQGMTSCGCGGRVADQAPVLRDLLGLFRQQGRIGSGTVAWGPRWKFRASTVRPSPGVFSQLNQSAHQPINVPSPSQVDIAPEYMPPWPFSGRVGFVERKPYAPDPRFGQMQAYPRPQGLTIQVPQYSTFPWTINVGGSNG